MRRWLGILVCVAGVGGRCIMPASSMAQAEPPRAPRVDHHQHLLSPRGVSFLYEPSHTASLPDGVSALLHAHELAWNDPAKLAALYTPDATALEDSELVWKRGVTDATQLVGTRFARPYGFTPLAYTEAGGRAQLVVYFSRGEGEARTHFGSGHFELVRDAAGAYKIAVWYAQFPGPKREVPLDAEKLVALLDAAGMEQAVVLSVAYWFDSPSRPAFQSPAAVDAENDWTAEQAARFPDRLIPFCSLNPVSDGALRALAHCVQRGGFRGLKLHFANAGVELQNPVHVARIQEVFRAAARARYPIVVHARDEGEYAAEDARVFVDQLLPAAQGVVVQIAHLWGGGLFAPEALGVFATAVSARKPGTQRLYFDVSDAAFATGSSGQPELVASRMRQIGMDRLLYGSDAAFDNHPDPGASWQAFCKNIPLTEAEFQRIARNVAPYLRANHASAKPVR